MSPDKPNYPQGSASRSLGNLSVMDGEAAGASARLAFAQALGLVYDRLFAQGCEDLIKAIAQRPASMEKLQRFQALEILNRRVERFADEQGVPEVAQSARVWATFSQLYAKTAWKHLGSGEAMRAPDETAVLVALLLDDALMSVLGLRPGWTSDLKRIDPDLDLKATDLDEGLS